MKKWIIVIVLCLIIFLGFWLRIKGIVDNHSFWSDEALVSSFSRDIVLNKTSLSQGMTGISYEPLQIGLTAVFFKLFGISEFSARLPSVVFGTIGILFAFLLANKFSDWGGGLLAAFLYAFSTLNLANSTQAKPYATIGTLLLIVIYLLSVKYNKRFPYLLLHFFIISLLIILTFIHYIGVLSIIIYMVYLLLKYNDYILNNVKKPAFLILTAFCTILLLKLLKIDKAIITLFEPYNGKVLFLFNNTMYIKNLLLRQYGIFVLLSFIGLFLSLKKYSPLVIGILIWIMTILFMWNFRSSTHNIRYLVPLFGVVFVFFGVFWGKVGEKYFTKIAWLPSIIVVALLIVSQYKIYFPLSNFMNFKTPLYFSPNSDFYGDVQIADYKTMFELIKKQIPEYKNIAIFNDVIDTQRWYMPEKQVNAYFKIGTVRSYPEPIDHQFVFGSLHDFISEKAKHPKGIIIVEDWQSILPEEIKQYAKKNMKRVIRVESLKQTPNDPWPLEVYEWGID